MPIKHKRNASFNAADHTLFDSIDNPTELQTNIIPDTQQTDNTTYSWDDVSAAYHCVREAHTMFPGFLPSDLVKALDNEYMLASYLLSLHIIAWWEKHHSRSLKAEPEVRNNYNITNTNSDIITNPQTNVEYNSKQIVDICGPAALKIITGFTNISDTMREFINLEISIITDSENNYYALDRIDQIKKYDDHRQKDKPYFSLENYIKKYISTFILANEMKTKPWEKQRKRSH